MSVSKSYFTLAVTTAFNSPRVLHSHTVILFNSVIALDDRENLEKALKGPNFEDLASIEFDDGVSIAARLNSHRCMPLLLQHKMFNLHQHHAMREAVCNGSLEVLRLLLAHPGLDYTIFRLLLTAAQRGQVAAIKVLVEDFPNAESNEAAFSAMLRESIRENQMNVMEYLLNGDFSMDIDYGIHTAINEHRADIVERLYQDPRATVSTNMLQNAIEVDTADIVELFLNYGVMPQTVDLLEAVHANAPNALRVLLKDGRVDPSNSNYWALRVAIERNEKELVDVFLADPRLDESELPQDLIDMLHTLQLTIKSDY